MGERVRWTEFRGRGFWSRDGLLELWLALLVDELDRQEAAGWKKRMRDDWLTQATIVFDGVMSAQLDDHIDDDAKRLEAIGLCRRLRCALEAPLPPGQHAERVAGERLSREDTLAGLCRLADAFVWLLETP